MINDVINDYTDKYLILNKKVNNTIEYIDIVIEKLSEKVIPGLNDFEINQTIENYIQILEIIKEGLK